MGTLDKTTAQVNTAVNEQYDGDPAVNVGWDDLATSLIGRRLFSNLGAVDYNYAENAIAFSANGDITKDNDCVIWNLQKPHGTKASSTLNMHFHYEQTDSTAREFTLNQGDVETLINTIIQHYGEELKEKLIDPETNQLTDRLVMFVNGANVKSLQGPKTELKDDDLIALFPPSGGG